MDYDHAADWSVELFENQSRRMEIIKKGFAEGLSTEAVNSLLTENYCETLYARNIYEAALIFAFDHHRTYDEWQSMIRQCRKLYNPGRQASGTVMPRKSQGLVYWGYSKVSPSENDSIMADSAPPRTPGMRRTTESIIISAGSSPPVRT